MSYCRMGADSDVYVIRTGSKTHGPHSILECFCGYPGRIAETEQGMIDHLTEHRERGDRVPQQAFDRLIAERDGKPYKTDVERALEEFNAGIVDHMERFAPTPYEDDGEQD